MADFIFPHTDLDRPNKLLRLVGSFWHNVFDDRGVVRDTLHAGARLEAQTALNLLELFQTVSRLDVPLYHKENWYQLVLKESERNTGRAATLKYGDGQATYVGSTPYKYGEPINVAFSAWDLPTDLIDAPLIMNRLTDPSLTLTRGVDYRVEDGSLIFRDNPFDSDLVAIRNVFEGNEVVDREAALWIFRGDFDFETMYKQFGYVLGLKLENNQAYKDLVNAVFDAIVEGTTVRHVRQALAAVVDAPLVAEPVETVQQLLTEPGRKLVVTDAHVYEFGDNAEFVVDVGDVVNRGDSLVDTLVFYEINRGQEIDPDDIRSITLGQGMLAAGYFGELVWENEDKPLVVETGVDGYTKVSWEISGWPGDVTKFFDDLHERGIAAGQTMAHLLDVRADPVGEPTAAMLPTTINPLQFLVENILRDNALIVKLRIGRSGPNALGLHAAKVLRKIVPPQTVIILIAELAHSDEPIIMEGAGTETSPGYEETVAFYLGLNQSESIDPTTMVSETVRIRQIGGRCR